MKSQKHRLNPIIALSLIFTLISVPAKAATSLGTNSADATFEIETSVSQETIVNDYSSFNDLTISGFTGNVRVVVTASAGTVKITTTTGLSTITGYQAAIGGAAAAIGFSGTVANAQAGLNSLVYIAAGTSGTGTIQVDVSSAGTGSIAFNSTNSHYYEYVSTAVTWDGANAAIGSSEDLNTCLKKFNGMCGYFATSTSAQENAFITSRVGTAQAWLGGNDKTTEGTWQWVGGPTGEKGVTFWSGNSSGSAPAGKYANWNNSEPNDSGGNEDALQILSGGDGKWNDLPTASSTMGYVIEYGGLSTDSITETSVQRIVKFRTRAAQAGLTVSSTTGQYLQPLTLAATGGSGDGAITWALDAGGTATGCSLTDGVLSATSLGTCFVTATKAQDPTYLAKSSTSTAVSFKTYLGLTTTNSASVEYNSNIVVNTSLGSTSKIEARGFTGSIRAEVVATGGNVQITTTTGVTTVTGYQSPIGAAATSIAFEGTVANVNNALDSLKYIATAAPSNRTIVVTISPISDTSIAYNTDNGHYYEFVSTAVKWSTAKSTIETNSGGRFTFNGLTGYFATVTSSTENAFITSKVGTNTAWIGGSDTAVEGTFRWIAGPESGNLISATYQNWAASEPNDFGSGEDAIEIISGGSGQWNDLPHDSASVTRGYVVEYGGMAGQTETLTPANRTISITIGRATQATLTVSTVNATLNTPFTLATTGGSGTGAVTYTIADGTATGCALDGSGKLISTTAGTCTVTATKAADTNYLVASSAATSVTFWDNSIATPTAPTVSAGDREVTITWTAVANASSYTVTSTPGGLTCTSTGTSCTISNLVNGVAYTFTVTATNPLNVTSSASSASTSVTPREPRIFNPNPPSEPTETKPTPKPEVVEVPTTPIRTLPDGKPLTEPGNRVNVLIDGKPAEEKIKIVEVTKVVTEAKGIAIEIESVKSNFDSLPVRSDYRLTFEHTGTGLVSGNGFKRQSTVKVWLFSDPIFLGEFEVDITGSFEADFKVKRTIPVGNHTLQINGVTPDNAIFSQSIAVIVRAKDEAITKNKERVKSEPKALEPRAAGNKKLETSTGSWTVFISGKTSSIDAKTSSILSQLRDRSSKLQKVTCIGYFVKGSATPNMAKSQARSACDVFKENGKVIVDVVALPISNRKGGAALTDRIPIDIRYSLARNQQKQ